MLCTCDSPRPLFISEGTKGGVGKSTTLSALIFALEKNGFDWTGFDFDPFNAHLARFNPDRRVGRYEWTDGEEWDRMYRDLSQVDPTKVALVDFPAQVSSVFDREAPRLQVTARSVGRDMLRLWVLSDGFDSVNLYRTYIDQVSCDRTFAVLNQRFAKDRDFSLWHESKTRRRFLELGGQEITLPHMPAGLQRWIDEQSLSLSNALESLAEPWLRYDLETFLNQVEIEFAPVLGRFS